METYRDLDQKLQEHCRIHSFSRERYIEQIIMMDRIHVSLGEKSLRSFAKVGEIKLAPETIHLLSDFHLIKLHKWFWDQL